jgi:hypothetical protein
VEVIVADLRKLVQEIEAKRARGEVKDVDPEAFAEVENKAGLKGIEDKFKKADSATPRPSARERMKAAMSELDGMKKGGKVSSASKRADGCAVRGKTKGRMV